ncbi:MAG: DUF6655 family protein [Gemmataceae bacterium]
MKVNCSLLLFIGLCVGCGTTRQTDSTRAASEMLLVSQAVDESIARMDFSPLQGKTVYIQTEFIDKSLADRGYLVSSIRQQLLAAGAILKDVDKDAVYVVELRTGSLGTDRNTLLIGSPQLSIPALVPGLPTNIPELALVKHTEQRGVAKIGVFAYNRITGRAFWQSGLQTGESNLKDRWVFGAGPFSQGSILTETHLAGAPLPKIPNPFEPEKHEENVVRNPVLPKDQHIWANADAPPPPQPLPEAITGVTGVAPVAYRQLIR